jgi:hypothetical protein
MYTQHTATLYVLALLLSQVALIASESTFTPTRNQP